MDILYTYVPNLLRCGITVFLIRRMNIIFSYFLKRFDFAVLLTANVLPKLPTSTCFVSAYFPNYNQTIVCKDGN